MAESEPTRQAESKVIPPKNPDIRYPDVAVIPPGHTSVIVIPKTKEVNTEHPDEVPQPDRKEQVVRIDAVAGEPTPK
jgi:hypothetical protein